MKKRHLDTYEFLGWEDVDGHRCLKVQFDQAPGSRLRGDDRSLIRFWIDMARGGHPLKVEFTRGEAVRMRSVGIQLSQIEMADGRPVWFPVRGRTESFPMEGGRYQNGDGPAGVEAYFIVDGTVRFNQGLKDEVFSVDWKGDLPASDAWKKTAKAFPKPTRRNDPAGIKEGLDRQLAEADADAEQIRASSPARRAWDGATALQTTLAASGIIALMGVVLWRWKTR